MHSVPEFFCCILSYIYFLLFLITMFFFDLERKCPALPLWRYPHHPAGSNLDFHTRCVLIIYDLSRGVHIENPAYSVSGIMGVRHTANSANLSPICGIREDLTHKILFMIRVAECILRIRHIDPAYSASGILFIENPAYTACPAYNAFSKFVTNLWTRGSTGSPY